MPGFDGTGPAGAGRMTGWGQGPCGAGVNGPRLGFGRGMGRGTGRGMGRGMGFGHGLGLRAGYGPAFRSNTNTDGETDKEWLTSRRNALKAQLDMVDKQLETL